MRWYIRLTLVAAGLVRDILDRINTQAMNTHGLMLDQLDELEEEARREAEVEPREVEGGLASEGSVEVRDHSYLCEGPCVPV